MKYHDALFVLLVCALAPVSLTGLAAGQNDYGAQILHAQHADFDALAYRMFGGNECADASVALKKDVVFQ